MSLFNITFDSETETSQESNQVDKGNHNSSNVCKNDENSNTQTNSLKKKSTVTTRRTVRYISVEDEKLSTPKPPPQPAPNGLITVKVTREKKNKINGVRYYFRCFLKRNANDDSEMQSQQQELSSTKSNFSKQLFIAKAKKQNSKTIPIANGETIHLRNPTPLAILEMDNDNTEFTLIQNNFIENSSQISEDTQESLVSSHDVDTITNHPSISQENANINNNSDVNSNNGHKSSNQQSPKRATSNIPHHLMVIKFTIPKDQYDSSRKIHITFLAKTSVPSPLISLPITSIAGYEGRYMIYSIKNSIIVDEKTRTPIITIRKTGSDELEIDTHFNLLPLCLFGLGIASFLGKVPTH